MELTLNDALSDYYQTRLLRLAPDTRRAHESCLERWRVWVIRETQLNVYLADIDDRLMNRYFNRFLPPGHSPATYNNYRQYLNRFWTFCRGEAWVGTNPMRHVDALRVPTKVRLLLSADELLRMLDDAPPRDRVALALGMNTALRSSDLARLKIGNVNLGNDTLTATIQKTKQEDDLPITAELRTELLRWLPVYGAMTGVPWEALPNTWSLIPPIQSVAVNMWDRSLGRRETLEPTRTLGHMERIPQRALERLGHATKGEGFHTLRRSALRVLFDMAAGDGVGDPIRIPQSLAGHKNRQTTEIYLGITHEKRMRDEMLRGRSFLGRAVEAQRETHRQQEGGAGVFRAV